VRVSGMMNDFLYLSANKEIDSDVFFAIKKAGWVVFNAKLDVEHFNKVEVKLELGIRKKSKFE